MMITVRYLMAFSQITGTKSEQIELMEGTVGNSKKHWRKNSTTEAYSTWLMRKQLRFHKNSMMVMRF